MAICKGCGIKLQSIDKDKLGYTPKENAEYCERCFRITHYGDLTVSMRKGIDADKVIKEINKLDGLLVWVVDLFDFEASMIKGLNRKLEKKDIILVGTKRDLLPKTLGDEKLTKFIYTRLKEYGISVNDILFTSLKSKRSIKELERYLESYNEENIILLGRSNVGKSTLLNNLLGDKVLTTSRYPGTTLKINRIKKGDITYIDTPGIEIENSYLMNVKEEDLKVIVPNTAIKPKVYQLKGDQSFALGGLARIDLINCDKASAVFYLSEAMPIHRSKVDKADSNWENHYKELYVPVAVNDKWHTQEMTKEDKKMDVAILGLGWLSISGNIDKVKVKVNKDVDVIFRKEML